MASPRPVRCTPEMLALRRTPETMAHLASYRRARLRMGASFRDTLADVVRDAIRFAAHEAENICVQHGKIRR